MPSFRDIVRRIDSIKNTQKITKAMQMVAASKLRRAQAAAEAARPYAEGMSKVLGSIASGVAGSDSAPKLLAGTGKEQVHLLVVCTAERGLCGPFNSSIGRLAREKANALAGQDKEVQFLCVGRKGRDMLRREFSSMIVGSMTDVGRRRLAFSDAATIATKVHEMFEAGEFDVCAVVYNRFRSAISQIVTAQQLIPFAPPAGDAGTASAALGGAAQLVVACGEPASAGRAGSRDHSCHEPS